MGAVPTQHRRRTKRHTHIWAMVERVMGYDVLKCACGRKEFRTKGIVKGRQMELFDTV